MIDKKLPKSEMEVGSQNPHPFGFETEFEKQLFIALRTIY
jgi:hypothetical protein